MSLGGPQILMGRRFGWAVIAGVVVVVGVGVVVEGSADGDFHPEVADLVLQGGDCLVDQKFHPLEELLFFSVLVWTGGGLGSLVGFGGCVAGRWAGDVVGHFFVLLLFTDRDLWSDFDESLGV